MPKTSSDVSRTKARSSCLGSLILFTCFIAFVVFSLAAVVHRTHRIHGVNGRIWPLFAGLAAVVVLASLQALVQNRVNRSAARKILDQQRGIYGGLHEFSITTLADFPDLDHDFYQQTTEWMASNGFTYVGDREDVTLAKVFPYMRALLRTFVGEDGTLVAVAYHLRIRRNNLIKDFRAVGFESELDDGTFLTTSNAAAANRSLPFLGVDALHLPRNTRPERSLDEHLKRLAAKQEEGISVASTRLSSLDDVIQFQHRMQAIKVAFKRARGFIDADDLRANRQRALTRREQAIASEIERLKRFDQGS